jgi:hypothetical protein
MALSLVSFFIGLKNIDMTPITDFFDNISDTQTRVSDWFTRQFVKLKRLRFASKEKSDKSKSKTSRSVKK